MRSILVNADRKPGNDARIDTALDLARQFGAHVSVLVDTPVTRYIAMDPMGGSYVISDALEEARGEDDAAASDIETRMARDDVPFDVLRSEDDPVSALANAARLSDLVIVSRSGRRMSLQRSWCSWKKDMAASSTRTGPVVAAGSSTIRAVAARALSCGTSCTERRRSSDVAANCWLWSPTGEEEEEEEATGRK